MDILNLYYNFIGLIFKSPEFKILYKAQDSYPFFAGGDMRLSNILYIIFFGFFCVKTNAVTYLFSHGFADTGRQVRKYMREYHTRRGRAKKNNFYLIDEPVKTFNYPDVLCKPLSNVFKTSLGQENELDVLESTYSTIDDKEIVLIGVSRGASVAATYMGCRQAKKIKAVIIISPFAHVYDVFKTNFFYKIFRKISRYTEVGKHPIDWIGKMDLRVPVMFICSKTDRTVPAFSTIRLHKKLVTSGHQHAYLLVLDTGKHAKFMKSEEAEKIQNIVHAFYKRYGLPCQENFAEKGAQFLDACLATKSFYGFNEENNHDWPDKLDYQNTEIICSDNQACFSSCKGCKNIGSVEFSQEMLGCAKNALITLCASLRSSQALE